MRHDEFKGMAVGGHAAGAHYVSHYPGVGVAHMDHLWDYTPLPDNTQAIARKVSHYAHEVFKLHVLGQVIEYEFFIPSSVHRCDAPKFILDELLDVYQKFHKIPKEYRESFLRGFA